MPLMAPLGGLLGISRQATVVLCFQLGDGLTKDLRTYLCGDGCGDLSGHWLAAIDCMGIRPMD